jgi:guanine deaminase
MTAHETFLKIAFDEAFEGMRSLSGGPFGAIVVLNGEVIGKSPNRVLATHDPTAHAEISAIRQACEYLGHHHLHGAVLYTTCEPCPMCLGAIYWAGISEVYYALTREDAERMGFSDNHLYHEVARQPGDRVIPFVQVPYAEAEMLILEWNRNPDRELY